jgi:5,10-methylenetetrahydromethanopterin reductase
VAKSTAIVRDAARKAGRAPESVRVTAAVVVAPDLPPDELAPAVYARAATYFVHRVMAMPIIQANGWDAKKLEPILATGLEELEMTQVPLAQLRAKMAEASALIPPEWIAEGSSIGSPAKVAARLREYRAAGADEILLHGATANRLEGLVQAYRSLAH